MTEFNTRELRAWALKGAEQRLVEIAAEAAAIYASFPELRDSERAHKTSGPHAGTKGAAGGTDRSAARGTRRTGGMSAAQRKAVGERMRKYWAEKRAAVQQGTEEAEPGDPSRAAEEDAQPVTANEPAAAEGESGGPRRPSAPSGKRPSRGGARPSKGSGRAGRNAAKTSARRTPRS